MKHGVPGSSAAPAPMVRRRVAMLGIFHETNTFSEVAADYAAFDGTSAEAPGGHILRGQEILDQFVGSNHIVAGYAQMAEELGYELVPLMHCETGPIGTITKDAYDRMSGEMLGMLRDQGPFDGVFICNHGAGVSEEHPDMEGTFATSVREVVGAAVPVAACLDMHANISERLIAALDICCVWRTCPHVDTLERSITTARLLHQTMAGEISPVLHLEKPPLVVSIVKQYTGMEPMLGLVADCVEASSRPKILDTSVVEGYPYADVDHMGMSWVAVADGDAGAARSAAKWMAGRAWERREEMAAEGAGAAQSLREAVAKYVGPKLPDEPEGGPGDRGPVVVMDVGDNIGGGSAADSTFVLREAIEQGISSYLQTMFDPEAALECERAGIGATVQLSLGGHTDELHGEPIAVTATVRALSDGLYTNPPDMPTHGGSQFFDAGLCAHIVLEGGQTVLVTSKRDGNTVRSTASTHPHPPPPTTCASQRR